MSKHVSEWLSAYHDGELRGNRLHSVEAHLVSCELCQAELESLESLSSVLRDVPAPALLSPERFASQVSLRLPYRQAVVSRKQVLEIGWWMIPVGLLLAWIFINTSFLVSDILSTANGLGIISGISSWPVFGSSGQAYWSAALGQYGILSGNNLNWAEATEVFTRTSLPQFSLQISIALLYLSWIAIWWARYRRQERGPILEG